MPAFTKWAFVFIILYVSRDKKKFDTFKQFPYYIHCSYRIIHAKVEAVALNLRVAGNKGTGKKVLEKKALGKKAPRKKGTEKKAR